MFLENIGLELSADHRTTILSHTKGKSPKTKPRNHNLVWTAEVSFTIWKYAFALKLERVKNKAPGQAKPLVANWFRNFKCGSVSTVWLIETLHSFTVPLYRDLTISSNAVADNSFLDQLHCFSLSTSDKSALHYVKIKTLRWRETYVCNKGRLSCWQQHKDQKHSSNQPWGYERRYIPNKGPQSTVLYVKCVCSVFITALQSRTISKGTCYTGSTVYSPIICQSHQLILCLK